MPLKNKKEMTKYDIFISYRREGGYDTAKHISDLLTRDGYKVSFDIDTLRNGDFDDQLLSRIDQCKDFILIVDMHCFDRSVNPSFNPRHDWLRQELAYALKKNKNIIPIFLSGVTGFPQGLPSDIAGVAKKNGPEYNRYYFNDFYKALKSRFIRSRPNRNKFVFIALFTLAAVLGLLLGFNYYNKKALSASIQSTYQEDKSPSSRNEGSEGSSGFVKIGIGFAEPEYGIDTGCFKGESPFIGYIADHKEDPNDDYIRIFVESQKNSAIITQFYMDKSEMCQADKGWLPSLLKKGTKVKIDYHSSGNAFLFVNYIETIE